MADYVNYSFVSWTDTTPITSVRLNQVSTNIEQVKIANEDKPKGLIRIVSINSDIDSLNTNNNTKYDSVKVLALELSGNTDNRVTLDSTRYYKFTIVIPGIVESAPGGEDCKYELRIRKGIFGSTNSSIATFTLQPSPSAYINTASAAANISNIALRSNSIFGSGTYSFIHTETESNLSFFVEMQKIQGASNNNGSSWSILGSVSPIQFFIEDVGGVA